MLVISSSALSTVLGVAVGADPCLSIAGSGVQLASIPIYVWAVVIPFSCLKKDTLDATVPLTGAYAEIRFLRFPFILVVTATALPSLLHLVDLRTRVIACCSVSPFPRSRLS